jgi:hypothetical protein
MRNTWIVYNAAVPTTAMMVPVSTGTAIKTLLQGTSASSRATRIIEWGITFTGTPAAIQCELIQTTTVAGGTPTAVVPTMVTGVDAALGTWGFSPATEGTIVATTRVYDSQILSVNNYQKVWELAQEPVVAASQVVRVRVLAAAAVNALTWVRFAEA